MLTRVRAGAVALAVAGLLFVLYPATRPWEDEATAEGAIAAMRSNWWVASHLFAMIGFILVEFGLMAVRSVLARTPAEGLARAALVTSVAGVGLTLPYYGAEDFGLNAIARAAAAGEPFDVLALIEDVRFSPVPLLAFAAGLLLLGAAAVLAALAIWRAGRLSRWSGIPFALGFALFVPQFYTPAPVRIAHGVLVAVGCLWVASTLWQAKAELDR